MAATAGALLLSVAACGAQTHDATATHRESTLARLGAVPIPAAPRVEPVATSTPNRPAVLEMGAPVLATLGDGARAEFTMLGPVQSTTRPGAASTDGTFTVVVSSRHGRVRIARSDFSSRDETGAVVRLRPAGPAAVTATPGHPARLQVVGHYGSGAAQVTMRHAGAVVAVWDFNIELD